MTTSSASPALRPLTRSEYVSTLPPWRRLLAMLNWRPVYDIEQETERLRQSNLDSERRERESEKQLLVSEKRLHESEKWLLASEKRLQESEKRLKQLQESNARIARFEQELFSSSTQAPSTGDSSPT